MLYSRVQSRLEVGNLSIAYPPSGVEDGELVNAVPKPPGHENDRHAHKNACKGGDAEDRKVLCCQVVVRIRLAALALLRLLARAVVFEGGNVNLVVVRTQGLLKQAVAPLVLGPVEEEEIVTGPGVEAQ